MKELDSAFQLTRLVRHRKSIVHIEDEPQLVVLLLHPCLFSSVQICCILIKKKRFTRHLASIAETEYQIQGMRELYTKNVRRIKEHDKV